MKSFNRLKQPEAFFRKVRTAICPVLWRECGICNIIKDTLYGGFCEECLQMLHPHEGNLCTLCGREAEGEVCRTCKRIMATYDGGVVLYHYDGMLIELIHRMKYEGDIYFAEGFGEILADKVQKKGLCPVDFIIPVPSHWLRKISRWVNIPDLLAGRIGDLLGRPVLYHALNRSRYTYPKIMIGHGISEKNSFSVSENLKLTGARVLLVDDVLTSGATMNSCAELLKRAGAEKVFICAAAGNT